MNNETLKDQLWKLKMTCDMNQRYHQILAKKWKVWDKTAKIAVAVTAAIAFSAVFVGEHWKLLEGVIAFIALIMAIVLNVLPFGEHEKFYDRMFLGWSHLRRRIDSLDLKVVLRPSAGPVT